MKKMIIVQHCHGDEDVAKKIAVKLIEENRELNRYKLLSSDNETVLMVSKMIGSMINAEVEAIEQLRNIDRDAETDRRFTNRVRSYMNQLNAAEDEYLILVTHSDTLSNILTWWMDLDQGFMNKVYSSVKPGSISILEKNNFGQRVLSRLNDVSHLS